MISTLILAGSIIVAAVSLIYALRVWRDTRQYYYDEYLMRKNKHG